MLSKVIHMDFLPDFHDQTNMSVSFHPAFYARALAPLAPYTSNTRVVTIWIVQVSKNEC